MAMNPLPVLVVRECLELIEASLGEPIDVAALARRAGYSRWHFQRVFQALVGEPVASYVRKRRLSESCHRLIHTRERLIEIAQAFQFESHEAYTRAFKKQFSVSPGEYRKLRRNDVGVGPRALEPGETFALDQHIQPAIVLERELTLVGLSGPFHRIGSDKFDGRTIAGLWDAFFRHRSELRNTLDDTALAVVSPRMQADPGDDSEAIYTAGMQVTSVEGNPESLERVHLAPRKYALFDHHGEMSNLRTTVDSIFAVWLVNNDSYTTDDSPNVEIYTPRFRPGSADSVMSIAVPLVPR
jgi:AraC family transcriptional regulator